MAALYNIVPGGEQLWVVADKGSGMAPGAHYDAAGE